MFYLRWVIHGEWMLLYTLKCLFKDKFVHDSVIPLWRLCSLTSEIHSCSNFGKLLDYMAWVFEIVYIQGTEEGLLWYAESYGKPSFQSYLELRIRNFACILIHRQCLQQSNMYRKIQCGTNTWTCFWSLLEVSLLVFSISSASVGLVFIVCYSKWKSTWRSDHGSYLMIS